jgi:hypothetical protein
VIRESVSRAPNKGSPFAFARSTRTIYENQIALTIPERVKSNRVAIVMSEQPPWSLANHPATTSDYGSLFALAGKTGLIVRRELSV